MKKLLVVLGLVAMMSVSCFALNLEVINLIAVGNGSGLSDVAQLSGVGLSTMFGDIDTTVAIASSSGGGTEGSAIIIKGYYPVGPVRVGLQLDSISVTGGASTSNMSILVGVKKTLVAGVDLVIDGVVYESSTPTSQMLNGGANLGLSIAL